MNMLACPWDWQARRQQRPDNFEASTLTTKRAYMGRRALQRLLFFRHLRTDTYRTLGKTTCISATMGWPTRSAGSGGLR